MSAITTKIIPVREAAERLGVSRQRIHAMVKQGKLRASPKRRAEKGRVVHPSAVWITVQSIEQLEAERRQSSETEGERDE